MNGARNRAVMGLSAESRRRADRATSCRNDISVTHANQAVRQRPSQFRLTSSNRTDSLFEDFQTARAAAEIITATNPGIELTITEVADHQAGGEAAVWRSGLQPELRRGSCAEARGFEDGDL